MKGAFIALCFSILLLILLYYNQNLAFGKSIIDIHFHDTYFVISDLYFFLFLFLFMGTSFTIGGVIGSSFKSKVFWLLLILFLAADIYCTLKIYRTFVDIESSATSKL